MIPPPGIVVDGILVCSIEVLGERRMAKMDSRKQTAYTDDMAGGGIKGVQFVVDERGEKTAVVIDLRKHRRLWGRLLRQRRRP
jgi:hypothetical protein